MFNIFKDNLNKPISAKVLKEFNKINEIDDTFYSGTAYECLEMLNCKDVEN